MDQYEKVKSPSKQAHFELQYELSSKKIDRKLKKIRFLTKVAFSVFSRLFLPLFCLYSGNREDHRKIHIKMFLLIHLGILNEFLTYVVKFPGFETF
jgi:hypothetical protein